MEKRLNIEWGQHGEQGRKERQQDFHGLILPQEPLLSSKGIALALADGISSSPSAHIASESAVRSFLDDYYCTSETWDVKTSAQRVIQASNAWLHAQSRRGPDRFDRDRGYVCTLTAMVLRGRTAHLFHIGDARAYRVHPQGLEPLTEDHRLQVSVDESYLSRALGVSASVEIDYQEIALEPGDTFLLATDGVWNFIAGERAAQLVAGDNGHADLEQSARAIVREALDQGSPDNLTVQIVRITSLPDASWESLSAQTRDLPAPGPLRARSELDGWRIERELHISHRSHVYLASDPGTGTEAILKVPATDLQEADPDWREHFLTEEWIARRVRNDHVLGAPARLRPRSAIYVVMDYVDGQTLAQWMRDHPDPDLETVRDLVEQIGAGVQAFHRLEMLHRDLRPENVMIDRHGTLRLIDFGAAWVASGAESPTPRSSSRVLAIPGSVQHAAPECFLGDECSPQSDIYALGCMAYQLLCAGRLPYGLSAAHVRKRSDLRKLHYRPLTLGRTSVDAGGPIPWWVDRAIAKAVHPDPHQRYREVSEFLWDLRNPGQQLHAPARRPLADINPVIFWQGVSALLLVALLGVLGWYWHPALHTALH